MIVRMDPFGAVSLPGLFFDKSLALALYEQRIFHHINTVDTMGIIHDQDRDCLFARLSGQHLAEQDPWKSGTITVIAPRYAKMFAF